MAASPAELIKKWLIAQSLGVDPVVNPGVNWPIYIAFMPDGTGIRDDAIAVYNPLGKLDGRGMKTGKTFDHPGIMIHVRGVRGTTAHASAYDKAKAIYDRLDDLLRYSVVINSVTYVIQDFRKTTDLIALGVETDSQRRHRFSINGVVDWGG